MNKQKDYQHTGVPREDLEGLYPFILRKGKGAYVEDVDEKKYIDFTAATGSILLGYSFDLVDDAVINHIKNRGNVFITKQSEPRLELAKLLCETIPSAEYVSFHKTGSDATTAAVRIAKAFNNRDIVLYSGYHGWHDWQLGIFEKYNIKDDKNINFGYNLHYLKKLIQKFPNNISSIVITPDPNFFPDKYVKEVQAIAQSNNIVFILDEVASGYKYELGGYQKKVGVKPDLSCFCKGLANGYSLSCVVGNKEIMKQGLYKSHLWSTFDGEQISMIAALETQKFIKKNEVISTIQKNGHYFKERLSNILTKYNVKFYITKEDSIFHVIFGNTELYRRLVDLCLKKGVILPKEDYFLMLFSHSKSVIDEAINIIDKALEEIILVFPDLSNEEDLLNNYNERMLSELGGSNNYLDKDFENAPWRFDKKYI